MKAKTIAIVGTAVALSLMVLAGCGVDEETGLDIVKKSVDQSEEDDNFENLSEFDGEFYDLGEAVTITDEYATYEVVVSNPRLTDDTEDLGKLDNNRLLVDYTIKKIGDDTIEMHGSGDLDAEVYHKGAGDRIDRMGETRVSSLALDALDTDDTVTGTMIYLTNKEGYYQIVLTPGHIEVDSEGYGIPNPELNRRFEFEVRKPEEPEEE
ncbi:hypothetical protein [Paraliobacillus sediminis]|uniref:hypothetical protein n=1 Tax=Paraliobacillus sediminis TaxID=1885916 RepID=UPI000E3B69B4|nr:hypothetical protein [Paraliobacillus sediminis]